MRLKSPSIIVILIKTILILYLYVCKNQIKNCVSIYLQVEKKIIQNNLDINLCIAVPVHSIDRHGVYDSIDAGQYHTHQSSEYARSE